MHLGAQTVLKALFSDQEEGTYRRIQLSGKLLVQEELYDMILRPLYYSEGRPGFSIAHVVSRLSYFGHELIDTHFVRALILGAIPLLSLIEAFSPNAHFDCELCYFCRDLAFNSKFRVGELYLDGMFYVAPDDHVKDISSWEETSSRYSGVLLDVGHPVLFRSVFRSVSMDIDIDVELLGLVEEVLGPDWMPEVQPQPPPGWPAAAPEEQPPPPPAPDMPIIVFRSVSMDIDIDVELLGLVEEVLGPDWIPEVQPQPPPGWPAAAPEEQPPPPPAPDMPIISEDELAEWGLGPAPEVPALVGEDIPPARGIEDLTTEGSSNEGPPPRGRSPARGRRRRHNTRHPPVLDTSSSSSSSSSSSTSSSDADADADVLVQAPNSEVSSRASAADRAGVSGIGQRVTKEAVPSWFGREVACSRLYYKFFRPKESPESASRHRGGSSQRVRACGSLRPLVRLSPSGPKDGVGLSNPAGTG
ncbi:hypothetical protein LSTR_LSTR006506 [Laodelphax striatellus]|uniref:Uncharacterized protein n=1 Tax=Laodelphax striatellus TaxID=195883 RepID=A0A482WWY4_LAOST|nr:hypothetical protein LSTR_LSTR006506 [Laodelphax striatellus]